MVTMVPVGRCVIRTADDVLFTCWPPAPLERKVSTLRSSGRISIASSASISGITSTSANEVWRRCAWSKGERRTSRCTPRSARRQAGEVFRPRFQLAPGGDLFTQTLRILSEPLAAPWVLPDAGIGQLLLELV